MNLATHKVTTYKFGSKYSLQNCKSILPYVICFYNFAAYNKVKKRSSLNPSKFPLFPIRTKWNFI